MDTQIPIIKPKKKKIKNSELLAENQIKYIQSVLDKSCVSDSCISKAALYEAVQLRLNLKIELYQFEAAITDAIRTQRLVGFKTRTGRNGGICRESAFAPLSSHAVLDNKTQISDGIFYYKEALADQQKEKLVKIYNDAKKYLYVPKFKGKYNMNIQMTCLGKHWNAVDNKYYDSRVDYDNQPTPKLPKELIKLAIPFCQDAFPYHVPDWDICVINRYLKTCTLGIHRDNSENKEALDIGHPVISFSIGAEAVFEYGKSRDSRKNLILSDGDVLLFGGKDRLIYHGITEILQDKERINFTLRKY